MLLHCNCLTHMGVICNLNKKKKKKKKISFEKFIFVNEMLNYKNKTSICGIIFFKD